MTSRLPHKIVVAIEGSQPSLNAAMYAIELAAQMKAQLVFLHVILLPQYIPEEMKKRVSEELSARGQKILEDARTAARQKDVAPEGKILETTTSVVNTICDFAEHESADLIILGTRTGTSAITKIMLGSVASGVANNAACPVMVVR